MTGPRKAESFVSPRPSMFPEPWGTLKSLFPAGLLIN